MMGDESGGRGNLTTTQITIFNQTYRVTSADGGERAARVARLVDSRMRETAAQITTHDVSRIAILTALQITDELLMLQEANEREAQTPAASNEDTGHNAADDEDGDSSPATPRGTWFDSIFDSEPAPPESRGGRMGSSLSERLRTARQMETESGAADDGPEGGGG